MSHNDGPAESCGIQAGQHPVGERLNTVKGRPLAAPMSGLIQGQHRVAMVRQPTREQIPHAVVVQRTVDEDDAGQIRVERLAACVGICAPTADREFHSGHRALGQFEGTFQVVDQVVWVFQPNGQPNRARRYPGAHQCGIVHPKVGG